MADPARGVVDGSASTVAMTSVSGERASQRPAASSADSTQARQAVAQKIESMVAREERAKLAERLRAMIRLGSVLWLTFMALDLALIARGIGPAWVFPTARLIPVAFGWAAYPFLAPQREPSLAFMRSLETTIFVMLVAASTWISSLSGGWRSHQLMSAGLIVMTYGMFLGSEWRRSLLTVVAMVLTMPVTLLVLSQLVPAVGAQLDEPGIMTEFLVPYATVIGAGLIALAAGDTVWRLRMQIAEARSIGRYKLRRRIAVGGMGEVWAAYHAGLRRDVAVKLIQARDQKDEVAIERFQREVRMLAELTHPNTIRVFDYGATESGVLYYAMELLDAEDLRTLLAREGRFSPERATRLVTQAAQALAEAHDRGIVHRDVKPANLLVVNSGSGGEFVKLIDFGIARQSEAEGITRTGMVVGTPGYMAPEVITGHEASAASDVYGLGMVLYELIAGATPFDATTPMGLVQEALDKDPASLSAVRDDVPDALDEVIRKSLARDPRARYRDAGALADALRDAL